MKASFFVSLAVLCFSVVAYFFLLPEKPAALVFILAYSGVIGFGYQVWKNPKILLEVEVHKVYKFYKRKGRRLFLKEDSRGKVKIYNATNLAVNPTLKEGIYCEIIRTPAQIRLDPVRGLN